MTTSVVVTLPAAMREIQVAKVGSVTTPDTDYPLTAGAATLNLDPTGAGWAYRFTEHGPGGVTRFCVVPDVASVAYADVTDVDPATLLVAAEPASPAWEATAGAALSAASAAAAAATRPGDDRILYVSAGGTDANSGRALGLPFRTIGAAVTALGSGDGGSINVAAGSYSIGTLAWLRSGRALIGAGRNATTLSYTGAGAAIDSATPGVRAYGIRLAQFTLTTSTGAVGIDLDSISNSVVEEVTVTGFSDASFRVRSAVNGGAVYNNFYGCISIGGGSGSATTGFDVAAKGSNTTNFYGCGSRSAAIGLRVVDSNDVKWIGGAIESNDVGWVVESTTNAVADNAGVMFCRFENNVTANWLIGETTTTFVRNTLIIYPSLVTEPAGNIEAGNRLHKHTTGGLSETSSSPASASGAWRFERTVGGAEQLPALLVVDSNTSTGTPVTVLADTGRAVGFPFRATRAGTTYWDVDAQGNVRQPAGSYLEMKERASDAGPAPADSARLYVRDAAGKSQVVVRFATGAVQVLATEP